MTENNEHAVVTIDELREIAKKNSRWRKAVKYMLNDDDVIISSKKPDLSGWGVIPRMKTTWRQVKQIADDFSEEKI